MTHRMIQKPEKLYTCDVCGVEAAVALKCELCGRDLCMRCTNRTDWRAWGDQEVCCGPCFEIDRPYDEVVQAAMGEVGAMIQEQRLARNAACVEARKSRTNGMATEDTENGEA